MKVWHVLNTFSMYMINFLRLSRTSFPPDWVNVLLTPTPWGFSEPKICGFKSASVTRWWWLRKKLGPQIPSGEEGSFLCSPRPPGLELSITNLVAPLIHSCRSQSQDTAVAGPLRPQGQGLGWGHSLQSVLATWARGVSNKGGTQVWCFF